MAARTPVLVPDIGDFHDVEVIEVLVKAGDTVALEAPLITLETDKATMDVPSTAAGRIAEVSVKKGDRVSKGSRSRSSKPRTRPQHPTRNPPHLPRRLRRLRHPRRPRDAEPGSHGPDDGRRRGACRRGCPSRYPVRACESVGAALRARARRRPRARRRQRLQGPHQRGRRQGIREEGPGRAAADGRRGRLRSRACRRWTSRPSVRSR